ncbi:hypothetical protein F5Y19DRAFT_435063 [Xylariaceae sp. FL1651]|nr:hypothetical protein F5Y19DRAFT_435063 [Xylariaceae sp. FL1651]
MYHTKVLLSVAAFAGAALAQNSSHDATCKSAILSLMEEMPQATGELGASLTSYASGAPITDVCAFSKQLPSSLQGDFSSHVASIISFVSASSSAIDAVITECNTGGPAAIAAFTSYVNAVGTHTGPLCTMTSAPSSGNGTTNGTASVTSAPTPSSNVSSIPTAAAPRHTGLFAGAAGVIGVLGAVALL